MPTSDHRSLPVIPGIYSIALVKAGKTDRQYIGSGKNVRKRVNEHVGLLRRGLHPTPRLQNAWTKHGEACFVYEVLEACLNDPLILIAREQAWIDRFKGRIFNARSAAEQFSSEWARSEEAKTVHAEHGRKLAKWWESRKPVEKPCAHCGQPYETRSTNRRAQYCSRVCWKEARKQAGRPVKRSHTRTCEYCGRQFETRDSRGRFCSIACGNHATSNLTPGDILPIAQRALAGERAASIARSLGVKPPRIIKILRREAWASVPLPDDIEAALREYNSPAAMAARRNKSGLSKADIEGILKRLAAGESQHSIARDLGTTQSTISDIKVGKTRWFEHVP